MTMTENEMGRVIALVSPTRALEDPSACMISLNRIIEASEGRKFLSKQKGEKALMLIELFDWALRYSGNPLNLNKGCILWTLRQLCAAEETLPVSCVLPIEFKAVDPHHAAGGFADVWRGTYEGRDVAFKSLRLCAHPANDSARLKRKRMFCKEVVLWMSLNHPNVLGLIGVCRLDNTPDARLTMVSEWMVNGNITEYIKRYDSQRMQLLIDCARGVQYLHRRNLVHGDLKGANILITSDNPVRARLADFGFMTIVREDGPGSTSALGGGTTPFMAPELLCPSNFGRTKCQVSKEADVYAFGMVILQVLTGLMPFSALRDTEISYKVIQGERPLIPPDAKDLGISDELERLLAKCWHADSTRRPSIDVILQNLSDDPARGSIFPPSKIPQAPSRESLVSNTQRYGDMFVTASSHTPVEDSPPFPMPTSPTDSADYSSSETGNHISMLFSIETQGISPITTPGNSHMRTEDPKPLESETPARLSSSTSYSTTIIANSTDDLGTSLSTQEMGRIIDPPRSVPVFPQHDGQHNPTIHEPPHVDLTQVPAKAASLSSPLSRSGGKLRPRITIGLPLKSGTPDSPGTAFYTPGRSGEVPNRRPFDSAVVVQVMYSRSSSPSRDAEGLSRRVVDVQQSNTKHPFPTPRALVTPSDPKTGDGQPMSEPGMTLTRALRSEVASPRSISVANPVHEPRPWNRPNLTGPYMRWDNGTSKAKSIFPRQNAKRAAPGRNDGPGEDERIRRGVGDDFSYRTMSTEYVSVPDNVDENSRDRTQPSSISLPFRHLLTKIGIRKSTHPENHIPPQTSKSAPSVFRPTDATEPTSTPNSQGRGRTFSGISSFLSMSPRGERKRGNKRGMTVPIG